MAAAAVLAILGLVLLLGQLQTGNRPYLRANVRIVEALPELPGARRTDLYSTKVVDQGATTYRTQATYALPAGTSSDAVLAFYRGRLPALGWRGGPGLWTRGPARLWLDAGAAGGSFSLAVDSGYTG